MNIDEPQLYNVRFLDNGLFDNGDNGINNSSR